MKQQKRNLKDTERKSRPMDQQDARRICKVCYKEAVRAEQMASVPLPGTIDVSRFNWVTAEVGKCGGKLMCDAMSDDAIRERLRDWVLQK